MSVRLRQLLVVVAGAVLAVAMLVLGLWQMQVFIDQGNRTAAERAQQPPVELLENVRADGSVGDVYGKQVRVRGHYVAGQDVLVVGAEGTIRVLSALQVADGRVLPVVRGTLASADAPPSPAPPGEVLQMGIFLPSEAGLGAGSPGRLGSVRLPQLAQLWPQHLLPGFVTLDPAGARAQDLTPALVSLPTEDGSWRNGGYAVQWWVFAAFAFGMSLHIAHTLRRREAEAREVAASRPAEPVPVDPTR